MKLNNKGFAISGILYGVLILFLMIVLTLLKILVVRIDDLDNIQTETIEEVEKVGCAARDTIQDSLCSTTFSYDGSVGYFITKVRGKYEIRINGNNNNICYAYLPKNIVLVKNGNKLAYIVPGSDNNVDINNTANAVDLTDSLSGSNCTDKDNITSFDITRIYSSVYSN